MAGVQFNHLEIPADDPARAKRFYAELFGWEFTEMPGFDDYYLFDMGVIERSGGAIGMRGQSTGDKLRIYLVVDAIDATVAKVPGLGGSVTTPRTEIPGQGWYAVINDSEGTELGLFERQPAAS
jgi:uncharacterized protein